MKNENAPERFLCPLSRGQWSERINVFFNFELSKNISRLQGLAGGAEFDA
jgi:hypothetical protein